MGSLDNTDQSSRFENMLPVIANFSSNASSFLKLTLIFAWACWEDEDKCEAEDDLMALDWLLDANRLLQATEADWPLIGRNFFLLSLLFELFLL